MDAKFLSYNNVVLRRSDLQILEGPNYLNDTIIDFYFEFLSSQYQSDEILLIPSSISFLIANAPDWESFIATIEPLNLHLKKLIFFTVNDNSDFSSSGSDGGSHWSLLVFCRTRNVFMHYDSLHLVNYEFAFSIYESVSSFVNCYASAEFLECRAPRQRNGYDCGLYVMEIARVICDCYFDVDRFRSQDEIGGSFNVIPKVDCNYVEFHMRSQLLHLILGLKKHQTN